MNREESFADMGFLPYREARARSARWEEIDWCLAKLGPIRYECRITVHRNLLLPASLAALQRTLFSRILLSVSTPGNFTPMSRAESSSCVARTSSYSVKWYVLSRALTSKTSSANVNAML